MPQNSEALLKAHHSDLIALLDELKRAKSTVIPLAVADRHGSLLSIGVLKRNATAITLNYEYPTSLVVSQVVDESLEKILPIRKIGDIVPLTRRLVKKLNEQGIVSGTAEFGQELTKDLILDGFYSGIDLSTQILSLTKLFRHLFELVTPLSQAIPQLPLPLEQRYTLYSHVYAITHDDGGVGQTLFSALQKFAAEEGNNLLQYAIHQNNRLPGFVSNMLLGIYAKNKEAAWTDLINLHKAGFELETLNTFSQIKIDDAAEREKITTYIQNNYPKSEETIPYLIWAYANIINFPGTPENIRDEFIAALRSFGAPKNQRIHSNLVSVTNHLKLSEEVKMDILSSIDYGNKSLTHNLCFTVRAFTTANFFTVIKRMLMAQQIDFTSEEIGNDLTMKNNAHPEEFSHELASLLCHQLGIFRWGGSQILQEIGRSRPFNFQTNLLARSPQHQSRIIKALMFDFMHPAHAIKYLLLFRGTSHKTVRQTLAETLAGIMEDYHYDTIHILRKELDPLDSGDKELLTMFETYHADLSEIITKKNTLNEFNPNKNQARTFTRFLRATQHKMREQINRNHEKDPLFSIVNTVSIARGKSWKIEQKDGTPSPLSEFSSGITFPRLLLMNPDQYNADFLASINTNYKNA